MQPTIICTARDAGMIYMNGRFLGEASGERPLFAPVSPWGAVYLEYRPLSGEGALARKLVFSGGVPLAEGLKDAKGLCCAAWPGGVLEVGFALPRASIERFQLEDISCTIARGEGAVMTLGETRVTLPEGALRPRLMRLNGAAALLGDIEGGGQYLAALDAGLSVQTGLIVGQRVEPADGGLFSVIADLGDSVGHGQLEQWLVDARGPACVSCQSVWSAGRPRWPSTAEDTVIAAVEAALAGLHGEAEGYFSPALAASGPLRAVGSVCDLCVPMKYAPPDPRPCVGLMRLENDRLATVRPLYYAVGPSAGRQGPWQIESISLE